MAIDISAVITALLAKNRGPDPYNPDVRQPPDYGIAATFDDGSIDLTFTFRSGSAYCCQEWGCHLGFTLGERWVKLREALSSRSIPVPDRLTLRLRCIVEDGALFFDFSRPDPGRRGWYAFAAVPPTHYEVSVVEGAQD